MNYLKFWENFLRVIMHKIVIYQIIPHLFQSSKFTKKDFKILEHLKIDVIIDLEGTIDKVPLIIEEIKHWPIRDSPCLPDIQKLKEVVEWGTLRLTRGKNVLTHCAFGRNRSGLINGEILKRIGWTGPRALNRIQEVVPGGLLNRVFAEYVRTSKS